MEMLKNMIQHGSGFLHILRTRVHPFIRSEIAVWRVTEHDRRLAQVLCRTGSVEHISVLDAPAVGVREICQG